MRYVVWTLIAVLTVLHQLTSVIEPIQLFGTEIILLPKNVMQFVMRPMPLFEGVIPPGLLFHAVLSVAVSLVWWLAVTFCWPTDAEVESLEGPTNREADA